MKPREKISIIRSIRTKFIIVAILSGIILFLISYYILTDSLSKLQEDLTGSRLHSDIHYIRDLIGTGEWENRDGALYLGDTLIGDGTQERANLHPFLDCEKKTGTFSYTFLKVSDEGLTWTGDQETGYMQGHYKRMAGSTLGASGQSIVGTYMDKKVADVLDLDGLYMGYANVAGRQIYCIYETLLGDDGEVVGAIVVGRGIEELEEQLKSSMQQYIVMYVVGVLVVILLVLAVITPWTKSIQKVDAYLRRIGAGVFPEEPLVLKGRDEMGSVATSVNDMMESLKEKEILDKFRKGVQKTSIISLTVDLNKNLILESEKLVLIPSDRPEEEIPFDVRMRRVVDNCVHEEDMGNIYSYMEIGNLVSAMEKDPEIELTFRAYPDKMIECMKIENPERIVEAKRDGRDWIWLSIHGVLVNDPNGDVLLYMDLENVDEKMEQAEAVRRKATQDPLTGLLNRGAFADELRYFLSHEKASGALFMMDMDHFKDVNDTFGHPTGDALLKEIAEGLKGIFRNEDFVCRLGGDEFCAFAKGFTEEKLLIKRAREILEMEHRTFRTEKGEEITVTTSVGIAVCPQHADEYDKLYDIADKALYIAKRAGRDCYQYGDEVIEDEE